MPGTLLLMAEERLGPLVSGLRYEQQSSRSDTLSSDWFVKRHQLPSLLSMPFYSCTSVPKIL